jgi:hypothetical protein
MQRTDITHPHPKKKKKKKKEIKKKGGKSEKRVGKGEG